MRGKQKNEKLLSSSRREERQERRGECREERRGEEERRGGGGEEEERRRRRRRGEERRGEERRGEERREEEEEEEERRGGGECREKERRRRRRRRRGGGGERRRRGGGEEERRRRRGVCREEKLGRGAGETSYMLHWFLFIRRLFLLPPSSSSSSSSLASSSSSSSSSSSLSCRLLATTLGMVHFAGSGEVRGLTNSGGLDSSDDDVITTDRSSLGDVGAGTSSRQLQRSSPVLSHSPFVSPQKTPPPEAEEDSYSSGLSVSRGAELVCEINSAHVVASEKGVFPANYVHLKKAVVTNRGHSIPQVSLLSYINSQNMFRHSFLGEGRSL
ncbi:unnamed protein product [Pleuronectes platessa]|uniref:Uncharacterized protein n=1 Tax=Pleuronectes platessa TaxID=8262 RepID=A0A9N7URZ6_PLEPL|nr:unnamed protein product [Pleuronectes platessa]